MWIWRSWMVACCVAVVASGCSQCSRRARPAWITPGGQCGPENLTTSAVEMAPAAGAAVGDCSHTTCGLNGVWLGRQVRFRTLHQTPGVINEAGLTIARFEDRVGTPLTLEVEGDVLRGRTASGLVVEGPCTAVHPRNCLTGARLYLVPPEELALFSDAADKSSSPPAGKLSGYRFQIEEISSTPFWTECQGCTSRLVPLYSFTVTSLSDSCQVELCKPELAADYAGGLSGAAVIFKGDAYDDATYAVHDTANDRADDRFNIACLGTAISKLHLLRHTAASGPRTVAQRQTLLRLLTADYCGTGHPFTVDGLPIHLEFSSSRGEAPTAMSRYRTASGDPVDALWDEHGAACLSSPRLLRSDRPHPSEADLLEQIYRTCPPDHRLRRGDRGEQGADHWLQPDGHRLWRCDGPERPHPYAASLNPVDAGAP